MKILLLGPTRQELIHFLKSDGNTVITWEKQLFESSPILTGIDFIISYGYRYILDESIVLKFFRRAINLHISFLPWNKGADPNLWSFLTNTPKGVSIHYIDKSLDTGEILTQKEVELSLDGTLRTSYEQLSESIITLFKETWPYIKKGHITPVTQHGKGTYHRLSDRKKIEHLLIDGWDTKLIDLIGAENKHE